jgi:type VI secretion system protein ImpG
VDPRLLRLYNRELDLLRSMGAEFAEDFPKIASRLGLERFECADPYVERLLEGFGFLAARVHLRLDAEFPRFTQGLFENIYPHYLAPTPSMAVVRFEPDPSEGALSAGIEIERGTRIRSTLGRGESTTCDYHTAHPVTLWPLEVAEASYLTQSRELANVQGPPEFQKAKAALRLTLRCTGGLKFNELALGELPLYILGGRDLGHHLHEQLLGNSLGMSVGPAGSAKEWSETVLRSAIRPIGFEDEHALLPYGPRSFSGYRLLQEYFSFPQRFFFVELGGLRKAVQRCTTDELEILILLDRSNSALENAVDASHFGLFCSPVVNLFEKRTDRINITDRSHELHVVVDRTRPMDFEVHTLSSVAGYGSNQREQEFRPFYHSRDRRADSGEKAYYTVRREPRVLSSRSQRRGQRSSYIGGETFISLVDPREAPYAGDLRELGITALCTNRDLPLHMTLGHGTTDFTLDTGAPVEAIRCVAGPTKPIPTPDEGEAAWRLISHLSLNYLSLVDSSEEEGAAALRSLLMLYGSEERTDFARQIEGFLSVSSRPITKRLAMAGPATFQRGLEVTVKCDESAFEGVGVFLAGAVLAQFFARYVSINSFTETVVTSMDRGEVMRWPANIGRRLTL